MPRPSGTASGSLTAPALAGIGEPASLTIAKLFDPLTTPVLYLVELKNLLQLKQLQNRLAHWPHLHRLSALKFLQALSAQLVKLTGLSFVSFQAQEDLRAFFKPLQPGDIRIIDVASRMFVLNGVEVGFDLLANLPALHVLMDQSKIGCAAAAWVASQTLCPGPLDFWQGPQVFTRPERSFVIMWAEPSGHDFHMGLECQL